MIRSVISQLKGPGTSSSHLVLRTSKRNNPQRQHGRDKAAGMKNLKIAFFETPSLFLAAFLCLLLFFLIMWPPGPWCTVVEANFGGREGDRGQARPIARLCRPPTPPPTDLLDNPEVDLALAACRWPAPALGKLFSPLQLLLYL